MTETKAEGHSFAKDLQVLLESGERADVMLVVDGKELPAHSQILSARSPVFAEKLQHNMLEACSHRIEITDVREAVLRQVLWFIYTDTAPQLGSMAAELLAAAHKYGLLLLKERCERQIAQDMSVENAAATAILAMLYHCPGLRDAAVQFIGRHPEVLATGGWEQMLREKVETAVEISKQLAPELSRPPPTEASGNRPTGGACCQPHNGTPAAAAPHIPPPDEAATSRLWSLSAEERNSRLFKAAKEGEVGELRALLAAGADVRVTDEWERTALHLAALEGHMQAASSLLEAGAEVNARDMWQTTPLHFAAGHDDAGVVRLLLGCSADHNARNEEGWTPLHCAASRGNAEAAAALLEAGAKRGARTKQGETPLDLARQRNRQQVIQMLS